MNCTGCGQQNPDEARFCNSCGRPLGGSAATPAHREARAYTPPHLVDKILGQRSALEGERKQVTVLFADVKGSLELSERLDPEEWHRILDRFFSILTDGIHRFEGSINQYTGDGVMALFGAPIAHEDHAQRACYAALRLAEELGRYAGHLNRMKGLELGVRMGLNSGEVVVGKIGDDLRMDYTAQGATVGLAARMEQLAEPGTTRMSEHTARLVEGFFELEDLGTVPVPGLPTPVRCHALAGLGRFRTRLDRSVAHGLTRFVGRDPAIASLEEALAEASGGRGSVVGVTGDPGLGKSRLCLEFAARCRERGVAVHEAHCRSHGRTIPFLPILELVRSCCGIHEDDDDATVRAKLEAGVAPHGVGLEEVLPTVFDFLGVSDPSRPALRAAPDVQRTRVLRFLRRLVHALAERGPLVLLIDDLHWIDPESDAFVAELVDTVRAAPALLLVNFRPEYRADWMRAEHHRPQPLGPLDTEAMNDLIEGLLGSAPGVRALGERIAARGAGNPLFVEEVVRSLVEAGVLVGTKGDHALAAPEDEPKIEIPDTVQPILAARIDRLPEAEKRLLQLASVVGRRFSEPVLAEVSGLPESELLAGLAALQTAELIHELALYPTAEYAFHHPLTHEVAYRSQLSDARVEVHAAVARAVETHAERLGEAASIIAHHWEQAQQPREAERWRLRAAFRVTHLKPRRSPLRDR